MAARCNRSTGSDQSTACQLWHFDQNVCIKFILLVAIRLWFGYQARKSDIDTGKFAIAVLTSAGSWTGDGSEVFCDENEFSTEQKDIVDCPDGMTRVKRVAVELVDVVLDGSTRLISESHIVQRRSSWIKVLCDTKLPDQASVVDVREQELGCCNHR